MSYQQIAISSLEQLPHDDRYIPYGGAASDEYDVFGNRIAVTNALGAVTGTSFDADNRPSAVSGATYSLRQGYDAEGRRTNLSTTRDGQVWDETHWTYDAEMGLCTVKRYAEVGGHSSSYGYDEIGNSTTYAANSLNRYVWGKDLSGTLQGAGGVGGLLYLTIDGSVYVPFYDNNGNVTHYCDATGAVVAAYTYDAFGNTLAQSGALAHLFRYRFSTKYYDAESGLYYYGYRFYHPALMRWLNRDPIEEDGGVNLYGYCGNNSLLRYDAHGQSWLTCFGDCVEEWRLDWSKVLTALNAAASLNAPFSKTKAEKLWIDKGVSENTTELSRAVSQGERLARKLPLGNPVRSKLIRSLGNVRRFMRNPALVKAGVAGAALTVFEGFYDIGAMLYCSMHCCGE